MAITGAVTCTAVVAMTAIAARTRGHTARTAPMVYTAHGFGGHVPAQPAAARPASPVAAVVDAYNAGRWADCETAAASFLSKDAQQSRAEPSLDALRARQLSAYAAARRADYRQARDRFHLLRDTAEQRSDHGKEPGGFWDARPTYEEEGAFQSVVCTSALGERAAAEDQYNGFMARYPQSILVHAAVVRIARFHRGSIPKGSEQLWQSAMRQQRERQIASAREESLCGPQCLAELLRRRGCRPDVHGLAGEMGTSERGTSLEAMASAARKRGMPARGRMLTEVGLLSQRLPVVALVTPAHYVIVDRVSAAGVTVWDPAAHPQADTAVPLADWRRAWSGAVMAVE